MRAARVLALAALLAPSLALAQEVRSPPGLSKDSVIVLRSLGADTATSPLVVTIPAGQSRVIVNSEGYVFNMALGAGATAVVIEPDGIRYVEATNIPVSSGASTFTAISRRLNNFSNEDALTASGGSIDAVTLPYGSYRVEATLSGTWPNATDRAGWLVRTGKSTELLDVLYTDTGGVFMRRATLSSGVLTWSAWVISSPTTTAPLQSTRGGTGAGTNAGAQNGIGIRATLTVADQAVGLIDYGGAQTSIGWDFQDNAGNFANVVARAAASPTLRIAVQASSVQFDAAATNTVLTGTTGVAGRYTISVTDTGKLYLENRSGSSRVFTIFVRR